MPSLQRLLEKRWLPPPHTDTQSSGKAAAQLSGQGTLTILEEGEQLGCPYGPFLIPTLSSLGILSPQPHRTSPETSGCEMCLLWAMDVPSEGRGEVLISAQTPEKRK